MQGTAHAKSIPLDTQGVFGLYADRVGKVQIVEVRSGAKSGIGSGFFVSAEGHILTNYHVISRLIHFPKRYRAEFIDKFGTVLDISVVAIDIVNDLAITRSEARPIHYFTLGPVTLSKGARLYSLGYPHNIGLSIVEGTYNGYLKHARYKKIHFTGSINPGMSGGPAITAKGNVVGINVATAGNQVSFLVPAAAASKLMRSTLAAGDAIPDDFLAAVRSQLMKHQQAYLADDIMKSGKKIKLGNYELPGKLSRFFNCWADSSGKKKHAYRTVTHQCSTNDVIYVSGSQRSGIIKFRHRLLTTDDLNPFRFYGLYSRFFNADYGLIFSSQEEMTKYRCKTGTVEHGALTFKTVFCARSYRKLPGLYDAVFKAAVLGKKDSGLETTLVLSGVSFEKALRMSKDYLERISWNE